MYEIVYINFDFELKMMLSKFDDLGHLHKYLELLRANGGHTLNTCPQINTDYALYIDIELFN